VIVRDTQMVHEQKSFENHCIKQFFEPSDAEFSCLTFKIMENGKKETQKKITNIQNEHGVWRGKKNEMQPLGLTARVYSRVGQTAALRTFSCGTLSFLKHYTFVLYFLFLLQSVEIL